MEKLLLLTIAGCFCLGHLSADTLPGGCDTLLFRNKIVVANILSANDDEVRYHLCGDTTQALYVVPRQSVREIRRARPDLPEGARVENDWTTPAFRSGLLLVGAVLGVLLLVVNAAFFQTFNLFTLAALLFLLCAVCGLVFLLKNRNLPRRYFRRAAWAFWLSFCGLLAALYGLYLVTFGID